MLTPGWPVACCRSRSKRTVDLSHAVALRNPNVTLPATTTPAGLEDAYHKAVWGAALRRAGHPIYVGSARGSPFVVPEETQVCPCLVPPSRWDMVYATRWRSLRDTVESMCEVGPSVIDKRWRRAVDREMIVVIDATSLTLVVRLIIVAAAAYIVLRHVTGTADHRQQHDRHRHHRHAHHRHHRASIHELPTRNRRATHFEDPHAETVSYFEGFRSTV